MQDDLRQELDHLRAITNSVGAALKFDAMLVARGLVTIAAAMASDDPVARTAVAKAMIENAWELDRDLVDATMH